ncbi:MAG TPA: 3-hydroxyacyl-CoA dehydrogenase family protein [Planctomycetes bacterium]|nr:3-hydroxyacyl-CoA dehydrogenase family protein [Fuerstiella sp.]HIK94526.1 3-hydroxyacyl-CoA dehydrogenase family protein [Planctomycetota bacterium]
MELEQIQQIAVVGLGRMGHGIAQAFATAGYQVSGFDANVDARDSLHQRVRSNLNEFVANDMLEQSNIAPILDRLSVTDTEVAAVAEAQFVVEAIAEERNTKQEFFSRIEDAVADTTIIASNSSTFTISESAVRMRRPHRAIVTHWFNPPHIVPTVEVVPGPETTDEITETTIALHRKIGKLAVRINGEIPGFLVNRVQMAMIREVWDLYERGVASPEDIDAAIRGSIGFRLATRGPLAICDFGGIDIWSTVYNRLAPELRSDAKLPESIQKLLDAGHLGTRTGRGIHDYNAAALDEVDSQRDDVMLKLAKLFSDERSPED